MSYASWTDRDWNRLTDLCRQDGLALKPEGIRAIAWRHMKHGADGGGNKDGLVGTVVALNVDKVQEERRATHVEA